MSNIKTLGSNSRLGSNFHLGFTKDDIKRIVWSAVGGFVAGFVTAVQGSGPIKDYETGRAVVIGAIIAGLTAAFSAVKNGVLSDASPIK